jgi:hypothetical protein
MFSYAMNGPYQFWLLLHHLSSLDIIALKNLLSLSVRVLILMLSLYYCEMLANVSE